MAFYTASESGKDLGRGTVPGQASSFPSQSKLADAVKALSKRAVNKARLHLAASPLKFMWWQNFN